MADPITGILKAESGKQQNNALAKLKQGQDAMKQAFLSSASEQMKNVAPQYAPGLQQAMDYASSIGMAGISGTGTQGLEQERAKFGEKRMGEQNQLNDLMNRQMDYRGKALDIESSQADQAIKDQQSIENEVKSLVGDDVNAYQSIMQSIGSDPEMAGMHNAASMAARHAARSGIDPQAIKLRQKEREMALSEKFDIRKQNRQFSMDMKLAGAKDALERASKTGAYKIDPKQQEAAQRAQNVISGLQTMRSSGHDPTAFGEGIEEGISKVPVVGGMWKFLENMGLKGKDERVFEAGMSQALNTIKQDMIGARGYTSEGADEMMKKQYIPSPNDPPEAAQEKLKNMELYISQKVQEAGSAFEAPQQQMPQQAAQRPVGGGFDVAAARAAGYSDAEIQSFLKGQA